MPSQVSIWSQTSLQQTESMANVQILKLRLLLCRCEGLILLETYTTMKGEDLKLPTFLDIDKEVTDDRSFSMYNLSKRDVTLPKIEKSLLQPGKEDDDKAKTDEQKMSPKPVVNGTS